MEKIEIIPIKEPIEGRIKAPGSKSFTNRALIMSSLCDGESRIRGFSASDDSIVLIKALKKIGVDIEENANEIIVNGNGGKFKEYSGEVNLGQAGTILVLCQGR